MKLSGYVSVLLVVAVIFLMVGLIVEDMETQYPETSVNKSAWQGKYDYTTEINESVSDLKDKFDIIQDDEEGWFERVGAGIVVIPKVIIFVPQVLLASLTNAIKLVAGIGEELSIPPAVIYIGITALLVIIIFGLISFWYSRSKA